MAYVSLVGYRQKYLMTFQDWPVTPFHHQSCIFVPRLNGFDGGILQVTLETVFEKVEPEDGIKFNSLLREERTEQEDPKWTLP